MSPQRGPLYAAIYKAGLRSYWTSLFHADVNVNTLGCAALPSVSWTVSMVIISCCCPFIHRKAVSVQDMKMHVNKLSCTSLQTQQDMKQYLSVFVCLFKIHFHHYHLAPTGRVL